MTRIMPFAIKCHEGALNKKANFRKTPAMLGTLPPEQIEQVLKEGFVGRIGCHADGVTYVVPISYAYDGETIYCHTQEGKKIAIMRRNPTVCFEVDEMKNMANWYSVVVQGVYEEITDPAGRQAAISTLQRRNLPVVSSITTHLGANWPFTASEGEDIGGILFRIVVKEKSGRFEMSSSSPHIPG